MITKGPSSAGVIHLARSLHASCVRGNHEQQFLKEYYAYQARGQPGVNGHDSEQDAGVEISTQKNDLRRDASERRDADELVKTLSKRSIQWLAACPLILDLGFLTAIQGARTVVVDAGLLPDIELSEQTPDSVMTMRSILKSKHNSSVETSPYRDLGQPWWEVWNSVESHKHKRNGTFVVYGHDAGTGLNPRDWSMGLDSDCMRGGRLSGLVITSKATEIVSVKCKDWKDRNSSRVLVWLVLDLY